MSGTRVFVIISGKVQGVFYRAATEMQARALGVTGWVRNRDDGAVEGIFEGPREKVSQLIAWCRQGPPAAAVTDLQVVWEEYKGEFDGFKIKY